MTLFRSRLTAVGAEAAVGAGAVILTLVPHNVGLDERAHPVLPWLMNGLTESLVPLIFDFDRSHANQFDWHEFAMAGSGGVVLNYNRKTHMLWAIFNPSLRRST